MGEDGSAQGGDRMRSEGTGTSGDSMLQHVSTGMPGQNGAGLRGCLIPPARYSWPGPDHRPCMQQCTAAEHKLDSAAAATERRLPSRRHDRRPHDQSNVGDGVVGQQPAGLLVQRLHGCKRERGKQGQQQSRRSSPLPLPLPCSTWPALAAATPLQAHRRQRAGWRPRLPGAQTPWAPACAPPPRRPRDR